MNTLKYVRPGKGFVPNFPLTAKSDVNGARQHPLYTYLKVFKHILRYSCVSNVFGIGL